MSDIERTLSRKVLASTPDNPNTGFVKIYRKTDNGLHILNSSGVESVLLHEYNSMIAANFTINSTTLVTPTGFSWTVASGQTWIFEASLIGQVSATPDLRVIVNAPATVGRFSASSMEAATSRNAAMNAITASLPLSTGNDEIRISGGFRSNANGTVTIQIRNNAGTTTQTFYAGSWLKAKRIS